MPGIHERRKTWVSTSGDSDYYPIDDEDSTKYCMKCESFGFLYQELGERMYKDDELINGQPPHDADLWRQCYRCGSIVASGHGKQEGRIKPFIEVPDTIHDTQRLKIEHFIKPRKLRERIKPMRRQQQDSTVLVDPEEDKDIQNLTKQSGREVATYSDSYSST